MLWRVADLLTTSNSVAACFMEFRLEHSLVNLKVRDRGRVQQRVPTVKQCCVMTAPAFECGKHRKLLGGLQDIGFDEGPGLTSNLQHLQFKPHLIMLTVDGCSRGPGNPKGQVGPQINRCLQNHHTFFNINLDHLSLNGVQQ